MAKEVSKHKTIKGYSKTELDATVKDARRYRWMRGKTSWPSANDTARATSAVGDSRG